MNFSRVVCSVRRGVNGVCVWRGGGESCECVIAVMEALMVVNRALSSRETGEGARQVSLKSGPSPGPLTAWGEGPGRPQRPK